MIRDQMSLRFVTRRPVSDLTSDMGRNFAVAFPARISLQPRCRLAVELPYPVGGLAQSTPMCNELDLSNKVALELSSLHSWLLH